jgi:hypothetical protein
LEEKATMLTNGYLKRFHTFFNKYKELTDCINELKTQSILYSEMKSQEEKAIIRRQNNMEEENRRLKMKNNEMQELYKKYLEKIDELEKF